MQVEHSGLTWLVYLLLGITFLYITWWKVRKAHYAIQIPLLTLIFAFAFTPCTPIRLSELPMDIVNDMAPQDKTLLQQVDSWSPATINLIFDAEQFGKIGIVHNLIPIISMWLLLMLACFGLVIWHKKKNAKSKQTNSEDNSISED